MKGLRQLHYSILTVAAFVLIFTLAMALASQGAAARQEVGEATGADSSSASDVLWPVPTQPATIPPRYTNTPPPTNTPRSMPTNTYTPRPINTSVPSATRQPPTAVPTSRP